MIVAGFGFRATATLASLEDALARAREDSGPTHLAAPDDKVGEGCFEALVSMLDLPVIAVSAEAMAGTVTPTQSAIIVSLRCTGSVAEAVALVSVGSGGRLLAPRSVSHDRLASCAIAVGGSL